MFNYSKRKNVLGIVQFYKADDQETPENLLEACLMTLLRHKAEYTLIYDYNSFMNTLNNFVMNVHFVPASKYIYICISLFI